MREKETKQPKEILAVSPRLLAWFRWYTQRYVAKHFEAVKISVEGPDVGALQGPLLVVLNHASWWDPLMGVLLSGLFRARLHHAVIEAGALRRYGFLSRIGFFGIDLDTRQGAVQFLRLGTAALSENDAALWVTAQGEFRDPRIRPAGLRPGVGHLTHSLTKGVVLPLALEYPFWTERRPVALARFGDPIEVEDGRRQSAAAWLARIEAALVKTQDALAHDACAREEAAFRTIVEGRDRGVGGPYDWWRRLRAASRGESFDAAHVARDLGGPGRTPR